MDLSLKPVFVREPPLYLLLRRLPSVVFVERFALI
jgi:hypothetical protein